MKPATKNRIRKTMYGFLFAGALTSIGLLLLGICHDIDAKHTIPGS